MFILLRMIFVIECDFHELGIVIVFEAHFRSFPDLNREREGPSNGIRSRSGFGQNKSADETEEIMNISSILRTALGSLFSPLLRILLCLLD